MGLSGFIGVGLEEKLDEIFDVFEAFGVVGGDGEWWFRSNEVKTFDVMIDGGHEVFEVLFVLRGEFVIFVVDTVVCGVGWDEEDMAAGDFVIVISRREIK